MDYDEAGKLLVDPQSMMKDGFKDGGRFLGVTVAWFLEKKFVNFSTEVSSSVKVTRCTFGILLLLVYEQILMPSITNAITNVTANSWVSFLFTFFELFLLIFLYPLVFKTLEKHFSKKKADETECAEADAV